MRTLCLYENLCQPCILQPTRVVEMQTPSLIDNIFINTIESPVSGNLVDRISDHFPNFVIIDSSRKKRKKYSEKYKRNTKQYNQIVFQI